MKPAEIMMGGARIARLLTARTRRPTVPPQLFAYAIESCTNGKLLQSEHSLRRMRAKCVKPAEIMMGGARICFDASVTPNLRK